MTTTDARRDSRSGTWLFTHMADEIRLKKPILRKTCVLCKQLGQLLIHTRRYIPRAYASTSAMRLPLAHVINFTA